jgi:hypothetical protein
MVFAAAAVTAMVLLGASLRLGHFPGRPGSDSPAAADLGSSSSTGSQEATTSSQETTTGSQETSTSVSASSTESSSTSEQTIQVPVTHSETSSNTSPSTGIAGEPCLASQLSLSLSLSQTTDAVIVSSSVRNKSNAPCVLVHASGGSPAQVCGVPIVAIYDQNGQQAYRSNQQRPSPKCTANLLQPGAGISQTDTWNTKGVAPGTFDVKAEAIAGMVVDQKVVIGGAPPPHA